MSTRPLTLAPVDLQLAGRAETWSGADEHDMCAARRNTGVNDSRVSRPSPGFGGDDCCDGDKRGDSEQQPCDQRRSDAHCPRV